MDVGGMQLPAAGPSDRISPTSLLVNKHQKASQLTQKLQHLNHQSSVNTALPSSNAQASTQDVNKGMKSKSSLGPDAATGLGLSPGKVDHGSATGLGHHSTALNEITGARSLDPIDSA